jgi:hypothetical protein
VVSTEILVPERKAQRRRTPFHQSHGGRRESGRLRTAAAGQNEGPADQEDEARSGQPGIDLRRTVAAATPTAMVSASTAMMAIATAMVAITAAIVATAAFALCKRIEAQDHCQGRSAEEH